MSNLGIFGDRKRQKQRYILLLGVVGLPVVALHLGRWWCPLVAGGQAFGACPLLWSCVPSLLSAFLLYACRVACKYAPISRFKGVFSAVCGVGVDLWGFCVREWLGGFRACCVFASVFILLHLCLLLFCPFVLSAPVVLLPCLSFHALCLCDSLGVVVVSFSLSDKTKKSAFVLRSFFTWFWCLYFKLSKAIIASL